MRKRLGAHRAPYFTAKRKGKFCLLSFRLERDGLVAIGAGEDGRQRVVRLAPAGAELFKKAVVQWRKAQKQFESSYGAAPATRLRTALKDVVLAIPESGT